MSSSQLSIAFSPCPNDTFIFCGLVQGFLAETGFSLGNPVYEDVETLNQNALAGIYDITKLSFHAFGHVTNTYSLLSTGSALGRGCGPLLVKRKGVLHEKLAGIKIAIPGTYTTAALLLKLFLPEAQTISMRFDHIMPSVADGSVDAGVIIHESRFTYQHHGLSQIVDLGDWWENETGYPIPLGGIAILKSHAGEIKKNVSEGIRRSIEWAYNNMNTCMPYIKKYAQELDDTVIQDHIALYVNSFSENLGQEGERAIRVFLEKGQKAGLLPPINGEIF